MRWEIGWPTVMFMPGMSVVLSRQIILSPEEKAVAIGKLREAYAEHEKQKASAAKAGKPAAPVAARH